MQFQRRQAARGRAMAVIVTSRTAVADRARIPDSAIVLRLEPFDDDQVRPWVAVWNDDNQAYFQRRGLDPRRSRTSGCRRTSPPARCSSPAPGSPTPSCRTPWRTSCCGCRSPRSPCSTAASSGVGECDLHADLRTLSFAVLAVRGPIVGFLQHGVGRVPAARRPLLKRHLCELFTRAPANRPGSVYDAYQPVAAEAPARCAAYSANLLLLPVLLSEAPIPGTELFAAARPAAANESWRRIARLWHSQLSGAEWAALIRTLRVRHFVRDGVRELDVGLDRGEDFDHRDPVLPPWPDRFAVRRPDPLTVPADCLVASWVREIYFRDDTLLADLFHCLLTEAADFIYREDADVPVVHVLEAMQRRRGQDRALRRILRGDDQL